MAKSYKAAGKLKKGPDGTVRRVKPAPKPPPRPAASVQRSIRAVVTPNPKILVPLPPRPNPVADIPASAVAVLKAAADPEKVLRAMTVTDDDLAEVKKAAPPTLSVEEKVAIIEMRANEIAISAIAARLGRSTATISNFLNSMRSTTELAQLHLRANALHLAERIVTHADIDQSLEVMDRLDVLNRKNKDAGGSGGNQFNIIVGMPSPGAPSPTTIVVPSQADLEGTKG